MTLKIDALVYRAEMPPSLDRPGDKPWRAQVTVIEAETGRIALTPLGHIELAQSAHSWAEAMQAAQVLRARLDSRLMDLVHESRAARRTAVMEQTC